MFFPAWYVTCLLLAVFCCPAESCQVRIATRFLSNLCWMTKQLPLLRSWSWSGRIMDQNCKGSLPVVQRVNMISTTSKYEVPDKWGQTIIQLSEIGTCSCSAHFLCFRPTWLMNWCCCVGFQKPFITTCGVLNPNAENQQPPTTKQPTLIRSYTVSGVAVCVCLSPELGVIAHCLACGCWWSCSSLLWYKLKSVAKSCYEDLWSICSQKMLGLPVVHLFFTQ